MAPKIRTPVAQALIEAARVLRELGRPYAVVGGLAVSARAEPRLTRDVDIAIAVRDDTEAESFIQALHGRGYRLRSLVEQTRTARLATARLSNPRSQVILDVLFASSGIEPEIVRKAESLAIIPDVTLPVARLGHLLALKILARDDRTRPQDLDDIRALLREATRSDLKLAEDSLRLIERRGFARGRKLKQLWARALKDFAPAAQPPRSRSRGPA